MRLACSSCGAALTPGAERCDLCGTPAAGVPDHGGGAAVEKPSQLEIPSQPEAAPLPPKSDPPPASMSEPAPTGPSFCIACGHANVPEARYCNRCGTAMPAREAPGPVATWALTAVAPERPAMPPEREDAHERPSSEPGKRALWLVGAGALVVVALYAMTTLGRRDASPAASAPVTGDPPAAAPGAPPAADEPVLDPESVADLPLPDSLRADAAAAAALVAGAERANTAAAWDDAGRLYLSLTRRAAPELRPPLARQAIATFRRSLEVADDPDVRTRMVSAYRYDPATTMQPVMELQRVLTAQPDHPEANFQMGELRLQIGRSDSAVASFARAAANAPAGSILQRDAQMMMERARQAAATPTPPNPGG